MANEDLGNIVTRLQGLKNFNPKRRVGGMPEFMENVETPDIDVSGTSQPLPNFANFVSPESNLPQSDLGGELTAQSYDVRANTANPPETEQEEGWRDSLRKLGSNLWSSFKEGWTPGISPETAERMGIQPTGKYAQQAVPQTTPIETAQVETQEGLPPVIASEQAYTPPKAPEATPGFFGAIQDYFSPTKRAEMSQYNQDLMRDSRLMAQGQNPKDVFNNTHEGFKQDVQKALENPWQYSAYGSAEQVANDPALQAQFKTITGQNFEPQIAAQVSQHEEAMKGVEDALNGINTSLSEQAEQIKQRILSNQTTEADKYYIGLALLLPLLIGGIFGKEAALGALGGGAQGIANVLGGRQKGIKEDEASLLDIAKQQAGTQEKLANINLDKAKLGPALRNALPKDPNEHLIGMKETETWTDPVTGEQQSGVLLKPGLVVRPEFVASKEGLTDARKAANELAATKTYVDEVNDLTDDVLQIVSQLDDTSTVWKGFTQLLTHKAPTFLSKMSQDVMFDGRKQNAGVLLEEKLGFLANKYGMAQELGQLDRAAQSHIKKIIENPENSFLNPRDSISQILEVRKLAQNGLVKSATNQGFYPQFLIADMEKKNNQVFGRLNQKENDTRLNERKKQALRSETQYAK